MTNRPYLTTVAAIVLSLGLGSAASADDAKAKSTMPVQQGEVTPAMPDNGALAGTDIGTGANAGADLSVIADLNPADPFGELDVLPAGVTVESVTQFAAGLNDAQKADLKQRCLVIRDKQTDFEAAAVQFCENWQMMEDTAQARAAEPPAPAPR